MVSSIGSYSSSILSFVQNAQSENSAVSTTFGQSFESLVANGFIDASSDTPSGPSPMALMGNIKSSDKASDSESTSQNDKMDLNKDGKVTLDEIIQYTQMQMMDKIQESTAEETQQNSDNHSVKEQQLKFDVESFKHRMAANAYKLGESLIGTTISAATQNFMI